jgi:hypothetical protein
MEWAGAFGDLGTLIPFVVAYIAVLKIDPFGILFSFGTALLICGLYYKTPFPVQPMKAIGAVAATQAAQTAVVMDLIDRPDQVPWGAGEPTAAMVPAAIGNAVFDAIGVRLRSVPFTPAKVLAAIKKS